MDVLSRTSGMKDVLRQMCTESAHTNEQGYGRLRPYRAFEKPDMRLKDYMEVAIQLR